MMTVAQKAPFELVALDGPASGFGDSFETAAALAGAIEGIAGLDRARLLLFGGWESASRGAGSTLQMVGERLGITEQFQGVDQISVREDGSFEILERVEGGRHQVSVCAAPPAVLGWATGHLPGAEEQSAGRDGQHADRDARAAARQGGADREHRAVLRVGDAAQTAARDADRQEHAGGRDRTRTRRLDRGGVTWKRFSYWRTRRPMASLGKPALEALTTALALGGTIDGGTGGRGDAGGRRSDCRRRARRDSWR